ncbi:hypothetical protein CRM22_007271 [Opisthorchis felineus]|uniref:Uncharacterized protein n=1 Tax=Opisthorchis felineus TaxID=147828 RepID=A0A4S2LPF6_OPIFE|nr:hypothetical protein CRM22_007271 [Opisthorchis felineus]
MVASYRLMIGLFWSMQKCAFGQLELGAHPIWSLSSTIPSILVHSGFHATSCQAYKPSELFCIVRLLYEVHKARVFVPKNPNFSRESVSQCCIYVLATDYSSVGGMSSRIPLSGPLYVQQHPLYHASSCFFGQYTLRTYVAM